MLRQIKDFPVVSSFKPFHLFNFSVVVQNSLYRIYWLLVALEPHKKKGTGLVNNNKKRNTLKDDPSSIQEAKNWSRYGTIWRPRPLRSVANSLDWWCSTTLSFVCKRNKVRHHPNTSKSRHANRERKKIDKPTVFPWMYLPKEVAVYMTVEMMLTTGETLSKQTGWMKDVV